MYEITGQTRRYASMLAAMSTDVVADVFSALVAAGTLGLAGATFRLGRATIRAAVDVVSPRLVVTSFWVQEKPLNWPVVAGAEPHPIDLGGTWSIRQHGAERLGLSARGHLRNEGTVTALFRFECSPGCEVGYVKQPDSGLGPMVYVAVTQQDAWYVLPPGDNAIFEIIWWRPLSDWAQAWRQDATAPPTTTCHLIVRGTTGEAQDQCSLTFGRHVTVPHPREDGWTIAVPGAPQGSPGFAPAAVASIGLMERLYPRGRRRRSPSAIGGSIERPIGSQGSPRRGLRLRRRPELPP
jgi:hypothetical protein